MNLRSFEQSFLSSQKRLLDERCDEGLWRGELSSSALATATATCALQVRTLHLGAYKGDETRVDQGLAWLCTSQNTDGGFGDTVESPSNVSTTTLAWASLGMGVDRDPMIAGAFKKAGAWLSVEMGEVTPMRIVDVIMKRYGVDRTFSAPILTLCALAGRFEEIRNPWKSIPSIPFELAAFPRRWFHRLGLPMVSYALPALIAIGQARHYHAPTWNPLLRLIRLLSRNRTLRVLESIQPTSGGFLEATPLTSFVAMSLVGIGKGDLPVGEKCFEFLRASMREDGSWPIDTDLASWVSSLSIQALSGAEDGLDSLNQSRDRMAQLYLDRQYTERHPYTDSPPGGWAWTDHSGGVPDADDTPGALIAVRALQDGVPSRRSIDAAKCGIQWLFGLQNRDGGIPTFCRGWGKLPFDRSSADLTAHSIRAMLMWREFMDVFFQAEIRTRMDSMISYLLESQRLDGAWVPLWFGNQKAKDQESPLYGTSRVLRLSIEDLEIENSDPRLREAMNRGLSWLLEAQNSDGGWGGDLEIASTIEETAFAVEALCEQNESWPKRDDEIRKAIRRGCDWLIQATAGGTQFPASPIGLYFAKLWYHEKLYPLIFTVSALGRSLKVLELERHTDLQSSDRSS